MAQAMQTTAARVVAAILDEAVRRGDVAGASLGAVDRQGNVFVQETAGVRALGGDEKLTLDTIFPMFSLTKLVTSIAALQLVEQGKLTLDEPLESVLPELARVRVLEEDGTLREPTVKITLRMLLAHTSGFSYVVINPKLTKYDPSGLARESTGTRDGVLGTPLVFEPGTGWTYGVGIDWAGEAVARISKGTLGDYFAKNIFTPLGITDIAFHPSPEHRARFAGNHVRKDGQLVSADYTARYMQGAEYDMGGSGLFGSLPSYLTILAALLNGGVGPNGSRILEDNTVNMMFEDQANVVPAWHDLIRAGGVDLQSFVTGKAGSPRGWGLSFQINLEALKSGRSAGSGEWSGTANLYYMVDPINGIAIAFFNQSHPFFDPVVYRLFAECGDRKSVV